MIKIRDPDMEALSKQGSLASFLPMIGRWSWATDAICVGRNYCQMRALSIYLQVSV